MPVPPAAVEPVVLPPDPAPIPAPDNPPPAPPRARVQRLRRAMPLDDGEYGDMEWAEKDGHMDDLPEPLSDDAMARMELFEAEHRSEVGGFAADRYLALAEAIRVVPEATRRLLRLGERMSAALGILVGEMGDDGHNRRRGGMQIMGGGMGLRPARYNRNHELEFGPEGAPPPDHGGPLARDLRINALLTTLKLARGLGDEPLIEYASRELRALTPVPVPPAPPAPPEAP